MHKYDLKAFFGWKLLLIMAVFTVAFQLILMILDWYYDAIPIEFSWSILLQLSVNYLNLLFVTTLIFKLVKWLNKTIPWSIKTAILRTSIDIILFSIITIGWIMIVNQVILYIRSQSLLETKQILYFVAIGTIINLFLIPLIEFIVLMNLQYQTELNSKQLQHENTKFRYEILKNQINPHFLFNSLSILSSLIGESPEKAKQYVNSFSNVLRYVLDFREYNSIELKEESKFLDHYLFLLNTRFEKAFEAKVALHPAYLHKHILPMVLQLLIENVIKHNKMSEAQPIIVNIHSVEKGIEVWNEIRLKSSVSSWGIGLENIKMRYASLGYDILVENTGKEFRICIPYIENI